MAIFDKYLKPIADGRADELHIYANVPPTYLLEQRPVKELPQSINNDEILALLREILDQDSFQELNETQRLNYIYESDMGVFRCQLRWSDGDLKTRFTRAKLHETAAEHTTGKNTLTPQNPSVLSTIITPTTNTAYSQSNLKHSPPPPSKQAPPTQAPPTQAPLTQAPPTNPPATHAPDLNRHAGMPQNSISGVNYSSLPNGPNRPSMSDIAQYPQPKSTIDSRVDLSLFSPENIEILEILHAHAKGEKEIDRLFELLMQKKGSDLHISSNEHPIMRIDGAIRRLEHLPILIPIQIAQLLAPIIPDRNRKEFVERWDTDFAYEVAGVGRFRANIFMDRKGIGAVFRLIPSQVVTVEQLGLPKVLRDLCYLSKGLVLVTGPTGSGKSTTLCALVDLINRTRDDHIITIEDPIEFVHPNKRCLINQREVGVHTDSFKSALRAALREDPDVVLVGELRDLETMAIAIETAETGHLVFGTLHTSSAISTVDRLIDQFPGDRQQQIRLMLANSLKGIISQTLLRKKEGGRIAAMEILLITHGVANLIRQQKIHQIQSVMQTSQGIGMQCLNDILLNYVSRGIVDVLEAYTKAVDKLNFLDMLEHAGIKTDKLGVKGDDNLS